MKRNHSYYTFPHDSLLGWNIEDFGPLYVPARGDSVRLNRETFLFYRNLIEWEQRAKLEYREGRCYYRAGR